MIAVNPPLKACHNLLLTILVFLIAKELAYFHFMHQGTSLQKNQRFERALDCYKKACFIRSGYLGTEYADIATELSWRMFDHGLKTHSIEIQSESVKIYNRYTSQKDWRRFAAISDLGWLYADQGEFDKAKPLVEQAVNMVDEDNPWFLVFASRLASLYQDMGLLDEAEAMYKKVIRAARMKNDKMYEQLRMVELAELIKSRGRTEEANELYKLTETRFPGSTIPAMYAEVDSAALKQ